jgi:hypothetical protein
MFPSNSGKVNWPWLLIRFTNGIRKSNPMAALVRNQIAGHPFIWLNSMVPKIADPPRIVASKLPEIVKIPAFFPDM